MRRRLRLKLPSPAVYLASGTNPLMPPSPTCMRHPILFFQPSYPALVCISCGPNRGRVWAHTYVVSVPTDGCSPPHTAPATAPPHLPGSELHSSEPQPRPNGSRPLPGADPSAHLQLLLRRAQAPLPYLCMAGHLWQTSRLHRGIEAMSRRQYVKASRCRGIEKLDATDHCRRLRQHQGVEVTSRPRRGATWRLRRGFTSRRRGRGSAYCANYRCCHADC